MRAKIEREIQRLEQDAFRICEAAAKRERDAIADAAASFATLADAFRAPQPPNVLEEARRRLVTVRHALLEAEKRSHEQRQTAEHLVAEGKGLLRALRLLDEQPWTPAGWATSGSRRAAGLARVGGVTAWRPRR